MKIKKISTQFSLNYIFILFIIFALVMSAYIFNLSYQNNYLYSQSIDLDQLYDDYKNHSLEYAMQNQSFGENDYIEVLDSSYKVIDQYNSMHRNNYYYSQYDFLEIISNDDIYNYYTYISIDDDIYLLLYVEQISSIVEIYLFLVVFVIVLSLVCVIAFSKYSASKILTPINKLVEGVKHISNGYYNKDISFEASNELDYLKDEINSMAKKLNHEIETRKRVEQNEKELIANISHDIKTPLTNIIGYSQTVLHSNNMEKESITQSLEIIHDYGKLADKLISELFEFSKLEMKNNILEMEKLDIVEIIRLKLIEYINEFESRAISYTFNLPDYPIILDINELHFMRAIDNIVQNSIKYNKSNFELQISLVEDEDYVILSIADDGIGIATEFHSTIFEPLTRVDSSRSNEFSGSGLGLSISKNIFEKHGASIKIDSSYTDGCRFIIKLKKVTS